MYQSVQEALLLVGQEHVPRVFIKTPLWQTIQTHFMQQATGQKATTTRNTVEDVIQNMYT